MDSKAESCHTYTVLFNFLLVILRWPRGKLQILLALSALWAAGMTQWIKVLSAKPGNLRLILGAYIMKGENWLLPLVLWPPRICCGMYTPPLLVRNKCTYMFSWLHSKLALSLTAASSSLETCGLETLSLLFLWTGKDTAPCCPWLSERMDGRLFYMLQHIDFTGCSVKI